MRLVSLAALAIAGIAAGAAAFVFWPAPEIAPVAPPPASAFPRELVERGEQLAHLGDCVVCHTKPGGKPYAGGLDLPTPFGTIRTTNITPDPETGIGTWSLEAFGRAMRHGVGRKGEHLYPAFPYDHFTRTKPDDMKALYAYMMTRPPVKAPNPPHDLKFPFNQRPLLAVWKMLFHDPAPFRPDPTKSAQWNDGAYYVQGLGHCGACHTPRNALGGHVASAPLAGGIVEGWYAFAIGRASASVVPWTESAMLDYLIDGRHPHHGIAAGPMKPVVDHLAKVPEDWVKAMAHYLTDGRQGSPEITAKAEAGAKREFVPGAASTQTDPALQRGEALFARSCANCHRAGSANTPLALTATVAGPDARNLTRIIVEGIRPPEGSPDKSMPRFATLSDAELTDLVAFVRARFADNSDRSQADAAVREVRAGAH